CDRRPADPRHDPWPRAPPHPPRRADCCGGVGVIVIRWASALIFLLCLAAFGNGVRDWLLAGSALALLLAFVATFGAFDRSKWIGDIGPDHPDALGSLDLRERGIPLTTAGGDPSLPGRDPIATPPAVPPST